MFRVLNVYSTPQMVAPEAMVGGTAVVIDVLRASTTIVRAMEAGAADVIPCVEVEEARRIAGRLPAELTVLGGERGGLPIDGFDLGNSPTEYTPLRVGGRTVVFTTTNGTRAIDRCRRADRVLVGAFVNATAVFEELVSAERIHLVCAGTRGQSSLEDLLLAGMLVARLQREGNIDYKLNPEALWAVDRWTASFNWPATRGAEPPEPDELAEQLRRGRGGRHLIEVDLEEDIIVAAQIDRCRCVPQLHPEVFRIHLP